MTPTQPDAGTPRPSEASLELRVLGAVELRRGDAEVERVLAQPSRLALLVYLLLRRPDSYLTRDELLGVFWPDSDASRARAALRQAVRFLRTALGDGIVVGRGSADLGIAPGAVACDALRFQRRLDAGEDEGALASYGGELLPGFHLSGAQAFDRWLGTERRRLAAAATAAALRLADRSEERGDLAGAVEWARRALELGPTREAVARRLIRLLDRVGDRASAVAAYDRLAERLRAELDVAPAPETEELIAAVRGRSETAAGGEGGGEARGGGSEPGRVLVAPLENRTGDEGLDDLGPLAADWIARGLADLPELDVVPPTLAPSPPGGGDEAPDGAVPDGEGELRARVEGSGAATVVSGAYYADGEDLRFEIRIVDVEREALLPGPEPVRAPADAPLEGLAGLREGVLACLAPELDRRAVHARAGQRPPSFEAYRAYTEGFELFVRGAWEDALAAFRRSAGLDAGYALPRIVSAIALWNLGRLPEARAAAREAEPMRAGIGPFERAVLDMVLAWLRGDWEAAHAAARVQAGMAPASIPQFQVAEEARRLNRPAEARDVLSRLDAEAGELRGFVFYWVELATAHHLLGEHRRELETARRARRLHPDHPAATLLEVRALAALGGPDALRERLEEARARPGRRRPWPGTLLREAGEELRTHGEEGAAGGRLDEAADWFSRRLEADASPAFRREAARTLYAADRLDESEALFRDLGEETRGGVAPVGFHHGHLQAHLDEGYLAVIAARRGREDEAERRARRLESLDAPFTFGANWFWLAALAAVRGEQREAARHLRRAFAEGLPHEMHLHTDPHLARLRGDPIFEALVRPRG